MHTKKPRELLFSTFIQSHNVWLTFFETLFLFFLILSRSPTLDGDSFCICIEDKTKVCHFNFQLQILYYRLLYLHAATLFT